jgi:organic radical activating enzyme
MELLYSPIPISLAFEPINLCNARCFCCPYTEYSGDKTFTSQKMSVEQITQLIEDWAGLLKKHNIKPWSVSVIPWRYSDPLLNPHLDTVLQLADKHKINVSLTTNAISFGKRQCDSLQKYIHTLTKIFVSVIGFTEKEVWDQMKVNRKKMFQSLEFVRDNYPDLSKMLDLSVKNKDQSAMVPIETLQEYRKRVLKPGRVRANRLYWMSNRLGKGDDVWTKPIKWKPSPNSFVNGCGLTPGKILNRLELMVSGRAALCCDMSYDRNFPVEKVDYGNVFEIGIEGVWANLTKEHQLIYDQKFSEKKLKLICNNCDRSGINSMGWTLDDTISRQKKVQQKFYT